MGTLMRRSSTGLGLGTLRKSGSKTSLSDSSTKGNNLKVGTTLQPQITPYALVSPVAESPAREAEASQPSPIVAPSPLGAITDFRPQEPLVPVPIVPSEPPAPRLPKPELQVVESPPNPVDSPQTRESTLPIVEQPSGKFSDYIESQPSVVEIPVKISREVREEPSSIQPQVESGLASIDKGFGIHVVRMEEPEPELVTVPTPEPTPVVIQVPEQQIPPPSQIVSDIRELTLLGPTAAAVPPEDHSPWASVITRNENLSSQPRTPPYHPRSLSPKQSRASFAGNVFESVNGSQQSLPRQVSKKPSKTSLAPSYTWSSEVDPQPKQTPQVVDHGSNCDAETISSTRCDS